MPPTGALTRLSLEDLERMLVHRQRELKRLEKQRARIQKKLDRIDEQIASIGGSGRVGGARGGRRKNSQPLPETIAQVLTRAKGPMGVSDIAEKVLAAGYRSDSANFKGIVNQALIKDKRFVNSDRGIYKLR